MLLIAIIVICTLIGILSGVRKDPPRYYSGNISGFKVEEGAFGACVGLMFGIVLSFMFCAVLAEATKGAPDSYDPPDPPSKILSFQDQHSDKTDASGWFVLGVGGYGSHSNRVEEYRFYQEAQDGTFFLHTVSPDYDTVVRLRFAKHGEEATAQRFDPQPNWDVSGWISPIDMAADNARDVNERWVITIPPGTLKTRFLVDEK